MVTNRCQRLAIASAFAVGVPLIKVRRNGTRTGLPAGALVAPGGVAVGPDGNLYVTNRSIYAGVGEVLRIRP